MACIDLDLEIPTLPSFLFGPPQIPQVPFPFSGTFCCKFSVKDPGINAAIQAANAEISAAFTVGAAELNVAIMGINEIIAAGQFMLDQLKEYLPDCPLDSGGVSI